MRLTTEDLLEKVAQLEEQARYACQEYPQGLALERLRYVAALARLLRATLERDAQQENSKLTVIRGA